MKKLLILSFFMMSITGQSQYIKAKEGETNYKKGFVYYDNRGMKITLLNREYRLPKIYHSELEWKFKAEGYGVTVYGWTSDCWIDLYTGKAFLNERTHQITYYDEVDIIPKNTRSMSVNIQPYKQ